jgi:HEPN domain-containing protein
MPESDRVLSVVRGWVEKAENDLRNAVHTLKLGDECPTDTVGFHAQQSVEKYLKALLVLGARDFPKTHDVGELAALLPPRARPRLSAQEQRMLSVYATITRYPGDYEPISLSEARSAVSIARRVRREIRRFLPKEVLGSKGKR